MTTELEEKFFKHFGIEPRYTYMGHYPLLNEDGTIASPAYPIITDWILLKLICIAINHYEYPRIKDINHLKESTLRLLIKIKKDYEQFSYTRQKRTLMSKIQTLFDEEK